MTYTVGPAHIMYKDFGRGLEWLNHWAERSRS